MHSTFSCIPETFLLHRKCDVAKYLHTFDAFMLLEEAKNVGKSWTNKVSKGLEFNVDSSYLFAASLTQFVTILNFDN